MEIGILVICLVNLFAQALILRRWNSPKPQTTASAQRAFTEKLSAAYKKASAEMRDQPESPLSPGTANYRERMTADEFASHAERRSAELAAAKRGN